MSDPIAPVGQDAVRAAIRRAADATGVNFSLLVETARRESALNPHARAGTSSATGLFQFIESTWLDMMRRHGAEHGLGQYAAQLQQGADAGTRREILALRNDPEISARMAAELARENAETLQARLGRTPSAGELYAAHVMGSGGAIRLIEAARRVRLRSSRAKPPPTAASSTPTAMRVQRKVCSIVCNSTLTPAWALKAGGVWNMVVTAKRCRRRWRMRCSRWRCCRC
jgi:hypothetical protein